MLKPKSAILVTTVLVALSGCSAGNQSETPPAATPSVSSTATASSSTIPDPLQSIPSVGIDVLGDDVPKPNAEQAKILVDSFAFIHNELYTAASIERSRTVCDGILGGETEPQLLERTRNVFGNSVSAPLSDPQIADILKVIKGNGYCAK